ncbi:MAG: nicotinamide-nucleotide amidohydrolase family protein [Deltaproteobacteria bacterium]|nr:nicotinamide-nucleotide amidohydrolase family protein [Deltaproteobacteria bacterium]
MSVARIEMLVIGDELLDGRVSDTNSTRFGRALAGLGRRLAQVTTITDDVDAIVREVEAVIARRTTLCVVSGGLGPTADDLTAAAFAKLAGVPLARDPETAAKIRAWLTKRGRAVGANQLKQADRPEGATLLVNSVGSAPGFRMELSGCSFVAAPGVPHEFDRMIGDAVVAPLAAEAGGWGRRHFSSYGLIEAEVDARLQEVAVRCPRVRTAFQVKFPEIHVVFVAPPEAAAELDLAAELARERLGVHLFSMREESFAATVVGALFAAKATLAVAESCTGGLVCDLLTDVPGASEVFLLGTVTYSDRAKREMLGVEAQTLAIHGAVSEATVVAMAKGVRAKAGSTYAVAISGIAGPSGGTPHKPVGTVHVAAIGPGLEVTKVLRLPFDRRGNKLVAAYAALELVRQHALGLWQDER